MWANHQKKMGVGEKNSGRETEFNGTTTSLRACKGGERGKKRGGVRNRRGEKIQGGREKIKKNAVNLLFSLGSGRTKGEGFIFPDQKGKLWSN